MTNETRKGLDLIYILCDVMDRMNFGQKIGIYERPRKILAMDLFHFLCIIAGADDNTSWDEVAVVNEILQENSIPQMNPEEFAEEIRKVYREGYAKEIPTSLKLFVAFDLKAQAEKKIIGLQNNASDMLILLFRLLGAELVVADREITEMEKYVMEGYTSKLKQYAMEELSKADSGPKGGGTAFIGGKR